MLERKYGIPVPLSRMYGISDNTEKIKSLLQEGDYIGTGNPFKSLEGAPPGIPVSISTRFPIKKLTIALNPEEEPKNSLENTKKNSH